MIAFKSGKETVYINPNFVVKVAPRPYGTPGSTIYFPESRPAVVDEEPAVVVAKIKKANGGTP